MLFQKAQKEDAEALAEIRAEAMKPSLLAVGRYDERRVRQRFLSTFVPAETIKIVDKGEIQGFYVVREKADHLYLDHLYIKPEHQGIGWGRMVVQKLKNQAAERSLPIRLGALRNSPANQFYMAQGFVKTHEDDFDLFYEFLA